MTSLRTLVVLCTVLVACTPRDRPQMQIDRPQMHAVANSTTRVAVGQCPYSAQFFGTPTANVEKDKGYLAHVASYDAGNFNEYFICISSDELRGEDATQSDLDFFLTNIEHSKNGEMVTDKKSFQNTPLGKEMRLAAHFEKSLTGPIQTNARFVLSGHCLMMLSTNHKSTISFQPSDFLDSLSTIYTSNTSPTSTSVTIDKNHSIEDRLTILDSLFKKGLITRSEYDLKKQEILSNL